MKTKLLLLTLMLYLASHAQKNQSPADGTTLNERVAKGPIIFRWTTLAPKPQGPVVYKLKIWNLRQEQNGADAMKTNKPVVEKEVKDITQAEVTDDLNGPCKPPYVCSFVWSVQAIDKDGKELGNSVATSFGVGNKTAAVPKNPPTKPNDVQEVLVQHSHSNAVEVQNPPSDSRTKPNDVQEVVKQNSHSNATEVSKNKTSIDKKVDRGVEPRGWKNTTSSSGSIHHLGKIDISIDVYGTLVPEIKHISRDWVVANEIDKDELLVKDDEHPLVSTFTDPKTKEVITIKSLVNISENGDMNLVKLISATSILNRTTKPLEMLPSSRNSYVGHVTLLR